MACLQVNFKAAMGLATSAELSECMDAALVSVLALNDNLGRGDATMKQKKKRSIRNDKRG